jgi:hypothetical protein
MDPVQRLQRNIERVRAVRPPDREGMAQREAAFAHHVGVLTARLRPVVQNALHDEAAAIVASEWANDARALALWLAEGQAPPAHPTRSESGLLNSALASLSQFTRLLNVTPPRAGGALGSAAGQALDAATLRVAEQLAAALRTDAAQQPSDAEVDEHAAEMAQLLISNWFGTLERAFDKGDVTQRLSVHLLPDNTVPEVLVAGCEAFAVPLSEAAKALLDYQRSLATEVGQVADLSPSLRLHHTAEGWQAARPGAPLLDTKAVAGPVTSARTRKSQREALNAFLSDWFICRPLDLATLGASRLTLETASTLAVAAAHRANASNMPATAFIRMTSRFGVKRELYANVYEQVVCDLTESVVSDWTTGTQAMPLRRLDRVGSTDVDPSDLYRISLAATAYALVDEASAAALEIDDVAVPEQYKSLVEASARIVDDVIRSHSGMHLGASLARCAGIADF